MRFLLSFGIILLTAVAGAGEVRGEGTQKIVRVAAIQCYSRMGEVSHNRELLTKMISYAATNGAKIVVTPECALTGYMDPAHQITWTTNSPAGEGEKWIGTAAEPVPGAGTEHFGRLARDHGIYLCLGLAEKGSNVFFNSQVLLGPDGRIVAHHRKQNLWPPGDASWVTAGDRALQTVDTEYGRLGLMICFDVHQLSSELGSAKVDLVLYSVGWYGPNSDFWFGEMFPRQHVVPNKFSIIVSNWSAEKESPGWPGHGYSCVINSQGNMLAKARTQRGEEVIFADVAVPAKLR